MFLCHKLRTEKKKCICLEHEGNCGRLGHHSANHGRGKIGGKSVPQHGPDQQAGRPFALAFCLLPTRTPSVLVLYRRNFDENDCGTAGRCPPSAAGIFSLQELAAHVSHNAGARRRKKLGEVDFIMPWLPRPGFAASRTPPSAGNFLLACFSPGFPECIATSCLPWVVGAIACSPTTMTQVMN